MSRKVLSPTTPSALERQSNSESARLWSQMLKRHPDLRAEAPALAPSLPTTTPANGLDSWIELEAISF